MPSVVHKLRLAIFAASAVGILGMSAWRIAAVGPSPQSPAKPQFAARPAGAADRPLVEITPDHRLKSVHHQNAAGLSPLEIRETSAGQIRIQRTFSLDGRLLKEEAFLNGSPVTLRTK